MANLGIGDIEILYSAVYVLIVALIVIVSYKLTYKEYINYNFSLISLFLLILAIIFMPVEFTWFLFLALFVVLFNLIANVFIQTNFTNVEESLVVDKKEQVWHSQKYTPELKPQSLKLTQGEEAKKLEEDG